MYRIDNNSAVPQLPVAPPPGTPGFFTGGNPAAALEATILDDWWLNMVQEEILTVVTAAGLTPNKISTTQLYEAIRAIAEASNPDLSAYLPLTGGTLANPGNLNVMGAFSAAGNATIQGNLGAAWATLAGATLAGALSAAGATLSGNLYAWDIGAANATLQGNLYAYNASIQGGGVYAQFASFAGDITAGHITASGNLSAQWGTLYASAASLAGHLSAYSVSTSTDIWANGALGAAGNLSISANASVGGQASIAGDIWGGLGVHVGGVYGQDIILGYDYQYAKSLVSFYGALGGNYYLGFSHYPSGNWHWSMANYHTYMILDITGPSLTFMTDGTYRPNAGPWAGTSDRRIKNVLGAYEHGLEDLVRLDPVWITYKDNVRVGCTMCKPASPLRRDHPEDWIDMHGFVARDQKRFVTIVAQDAEDIFPELFSQVPAMIDGEEVDDLRMLDPGPLTYAFINAFKEVEQRLRALEAATGRRP